MKYLKGIFGLILKIRENLKIPVQTTYKQALRGLLTSGTSLPV